MRKKVLCVILGTVFMAANPMYGFTAQIDLSQRVFVEQDASSVDGYYVVNGETLLIMNGIAYNVNPESGSAKDTEEDIHVYMSGNDFVLQANSSALAFLYQEEKGETAKGGMYYAMYSDYRGTTEEADCIEGKDIQIGEFVFGNDYYVAEREPLSVFFQVSPEQDPENGAADQTAAGQNKIEGSGFGTPEEAVTWYVEELKVMDIDKMISAYAVESFAEHYQFEKDIEDKGYYGAAAYPWIERDNDYVKALNLENRRSKILIDITKQYLSLTGSGLYTEEGGALRLTKTGETLDELLDRVFPEVENGFLQNMEVQEFTTQEDVEGLCGEERTQKYVENYKEICGAEDFRPVAALLQLNGEDWIISFDTVEYDGRWYLYQTCGIIGNYLGMDYWSNGGVQSVEAIEEKYKKAEAEAESEAEEWESESETED